MSDKQFDNLQPEDFWPDAEKMLDSHFSAKRRNRRVAYFLAALLIGIAGYFTLSINHPSNSDHSNSSSTPFQKDQKQKNNSAQSTPVPANTQTTVHNSENIPLQNKKDYTENISTTSVNVKPATAQKVSSKNTLTGNSLQALAKSVHHHKPIGETASIITQVSGAEVKNESETKSQITQDGNDSPAQSKSVDEKKSVTAEVMLQREDITFSAHHPAAITVVTDYSPAGSDIVTGNEVKQNLSEWRIDFFAGANYIFKTLSSPEYDVTVRRREAEEDNITTPSFSVNLTRLIKNWEISAGAGIFVAGEQTNYTPYLMKDVAIDNSYWNTFYHTVAVTDTNYLYGYVYYTHYNVQRLDSTYIIKMDTVEAPSYDQSLQNKHTYNHLTYLSFPVRITWNFGGRRLTTGVTAGVTPMLLENRTGYYLRDDLSGIESVAEMKTLRSMVLTANAGLSFRYYLKPKFNLLLRTEYSHMLSPATTESKKVAQRYSAIGVFAGVSFLLK